MRYSLLDGGKPRAKAHYVVDLCHIIAAITGCSYGKLEQEYYKHGDDFNHRGYSIKCEP
jgi:hypothetical protein